MKSAILNTEQVQALQRGERVTVRRVMRKQPEQEYQLSGMFHFDGRRIARFWKPGDPLDINIVDFPSPYAPGDVVWVRETFYQSGDRFRAYPDDDEYSGWNGTKDVWYAADGIPPCRGDNAWGKQRDNAEQAAKGSNFFPDKGRNYWRKFPSSQMPHWAARLYAACVTVKAEQVDGKWYFSSEFEKCDKPEEIDEQLQHLH